MTYYDYYLKAIWKAMNKKRHEFVRFSDIEKEVNVSSSAITKALKKLVKEGYLEKIDRGIYKPTPKFYKEVNRILKS